METVEIDWARCPTVPRQHQRDGVIALVRDAEPGIGRVVSGVFMLADEVGAGKTKQQIDAAEVIYEVGLIDTVVVLVPAFARGVWADPDPALGEIAKHGWPSVPNYVLEYSVRHPKLIVPADSQKDLLWIVSNYEFIRRKERLAPLLTFLANRRYWLVCDEAWALKCHATAQWKAANAIRRHAVRVTLLNGSPIADSPLDLFAQMRLLDPSILEHQVRDLRGRLRWSGFVPFRAQYAQLKPNDTRPIIIGWQNLEELRAKVAPYVLRRTTRECFDLPPILDPVLIEGRLTDENWRRYKQMRDDMVAWLDANEASVAKQAVVKGLRLAQITSGFLGGIQEIGFDVNPEGLMFNEPAYGDGKHPVVVETTRVEEIGREKLDAMLAWLEQVNPQPNRILIWCRFRPEIERTAEALRGLDRLVFKLYGQQSPADREAAIRALAPDIDPGEPVGVVGQPQAGGAALNLAGASLAIYLSNDFNLRSRVQSMGRIDRPGQRHPIRYADVVATGPKGQRTIDHAVLAALREKKDIADWTTATWRKALLDE